MKSMGHLVLRGSLGLLVLTGAVLILCLDTLDQRPYFTSTYYAQTIRQLETQAAVANLTTGALSAGFGRALLTPVLNAPQDEPRNGRFVSLPLAGYGSRRGHPATGTHDDVFVKAIAFEVGTQRCVIVSSDALIVPREIADAAASHLARELRLHRDQLYLAATHAHSSLGGWGEGVVAEAFAGGYQPGVRTWWTDRIVSAVRAALADLRPASIGHGSFIATNFVRNRLVGPIGGIDPSFDFVVVRQSHGNTGILGSYGAHATVLPSGFMQFSADYPGAWQRAVEESTGGTALFLAGAVGSQSPVPRKGNSAGAEQMGQALARAVLDRLPATPDTNIVTFGTLGLEVGLPPLQARVTDGIRLRPWIARRLLPVHELSFLQALRLDDSIWVSTPCDFSGELGLGIKESFRVRGFELAITSFNGDYIGYIIPSRYYHLGGYEPKVMSFFGPQMPDYLTDLVRRLASALTSE